jgi:hypothetical protein
MRPARTGTASRERAVIGARRRRAFDPQECERPGAVRHRLRSAALRVHGALLARLRSGGRGRCCVRGASKCKGLCETANEAELSVPGLLVVFTSVTTKPILAPHGYSSAGGARQSRDNLRSAELSSEEFVDAASTSIGRPVLLMLCTFFLALHKALILSVFNRIRDDRGRYFCRFNLEQFRVFVKHWAAELIRPEEETRHAGEPT